MKSTSTGPPWSLIRTSGHSLRDRVVSVTPLSQDLTARVSFGALDGMLREAQT